MKSLDDIKTDMSDLYENVKSGETDLKLAAELANIAGKFLKAEQLKLAREIFTSGQGSLLHSVTSEQPPVLDHKQ